MRFISATVRKHALETIGKFPAREIAFFFGFIFFISTHVGAQNKYTIPSYNMQVKGTSNLHDWALNATKLQGSCELNCEGQEIKDLKLVYVEVPTDGLKSENNSNAMDENVYKALKSPTYKSIIFNMNKINSISPSGDGYDLNLDGTITIAGVTLPNTVSVHGRVEPTGVITIAGSKKIKMTDYKVVPPTALLGMLKTGDEIEIAFKIYLTKLLNQIKPN